MAIAQPPSETDGASKVPSLTVWHVFATAVVVAGLLAALWLVLPRFTTATDIATVLGVVIPGFVTIGAAVFGVTVAYQTGNTNGKTKGAKEGAASKAAELRPAVDQLAADLNPLLNTIRTGTSSPAGDSRLLFASGTTGLQLDGDALANVQADLATVRALL